MQAEQREVAAIILAAGQGTRMKSRRAKVLHDLCGRPMLEHVLAAAEGLAPGRRLVVVGRDADEVRATFAGRAEFVLQAEQRGTGHAVVVAAREIADFEGDVLILYGDTPLLRAETLARMGALKAETGADLVLLSARFPLPGRIVRGASGDVERIVEMTDATPEEQTIEEGNVGTYLVDAGFLREGIAKLEDTNAQGEFYITDLVGMAVSGGRKVEAMCLEDSDESRGLNTRAELAAAAALLRRRTAERLMADGVTLVDPESTYIDVDVKIGRDTVIEPGCVIQGNTVIGEGCWIKAHTTIESSRLDDDVILGPCAHLRPDNHLMRGVKIGNFVEIKNSNVGAGTKAAHLTYIGDADVGEGVTFGCGTIIVNYDGIEKHRSVVGDRAFVGCNSNLVSPLEIGEDTFVAAGTTVSLDVPRDSLVVGRARQRVVPGWVSRRAGRKAGEPKSAPASEADAGNRGERAPKRTARKKSAPRKSARTSSSNATSSKTGSKSPNETARKNARKQAARKRTVGKAGRKKAAAARKRPDRKKSSR